MRVDEHAGADGFRAAAEAFLEREEAENNPVLGRMERFGLPGGTGIVRAFGVRAGAEVLAAAVETGARGLLLSVGPRAAFEALAEELRSRGADISSADGPEPAVAAFGARWCALAGARADVHMQLRLHRLDAVRELEYAPGVLRAAQPSDLTLAARWWQAFCAEASVPAPPPGRVPALEQGRLFLWEPGPGRAPAAMAAWSRPTRRGCSVGGVYTPPEERGQGCATALVAALSRHLLGEGRTFCTLFTDRANPVSNRIYARIGYRALADHVRVGFAPHSSALDEGVPGRAAIPPLP